MRDGVSSEQARAELTTIARRLEEAYPRENADPTMRMASLSEETLGDVRSALLLLLSSVGFVLLISGRRS